MSLSCDGVFRLCQESQFLRHAHTNLNGLSGPSTQSTQLYFYYVSPHLPHILTVIIYLCNSEQSSCLAADNPTCPLLYALMPILADTSPQHGPCWLKWQISSSARFKSLRRMFAFSRVLKRFVSALWYQPENISHKTRRPPPYLQQTGSAETARSTQTAETSFWLPGALPSSPPAIYTAPAEGQRACQWTWRSATATISAIVGQRAAAWPNQESWAAERSRKKLPDHVVGFNKQQCFNTGFVLL